MAQRDKGNPRKKGGACGIRDNISPIGKSPITIPEGYCCDTIDGFFPAELKKAGSEGVVVEERALKPICQYGERIGNLQRAILVREGRRVPEADFPPEYNFTEPLQAIPHFPVTMVPGPDEEAVDIKGKILDRDKFTSMLKEYYCLRGWDEETGLPKAESLATLGLDDLVPTFQ